MPSVYVKTMGCKVNTFDSSALSQRFFDAKCSIVDRPSDADILVINSCSVTANAEREARYWARRFRRDSAQSFIVCTGCYAQTDAKRLLAMSEIDAVVPNEAKPDLVPFVLAQWCARYEKKWPGASETKDYRRFPTALQPVSQNRQSHFKSSLTLFDRAGWGRARAFVKIQDGCNAFCSYCLIPYARGQARSVPRQTVLQELQRLGERRCPEIVITGIHVGDYGRDLDDYRGDPHPLVNLLDEAFAMRDLPQIRISSLEPSEVSSSLLDLLYRHRERFCAHFHLPLQSASNNVLKKMRRQYTCEHYAETVAAIRHRFPAAAIGADVLVGFPGESAHDHQRTLECVQELKLAYLHVFPYSRRPRTAADRFPDHVPAAIRKARCQELREISDQLRARYLSASLGSTKEIIWLDEWDQQGRRKGITRESIQVVAPDQPEALPRKGLARLAGLVKQGVVLAHPQPHSTIL